jgi:hypothetical protein
MSRIESFAKRRAEAAAEEAKDSGHSFEFAEVFRKISFRT